MAQQSTREKLLQAARRLLEEDVPPDELTARRLTAEAGVNLSMINYCFHSKDALLKAAVDEIVAAEFRRHAGEAPPGSTPRQQLRARLLPVCLAMLKYRALTQASIPYLLLEEPSRFPWIFCPASGPISAPPNRKRPAGWPPSAWFILCNLPSTAERNFSGITGLKSTATLAQPPFWTLSSICFWEVNR